MPFPFSRLPFPHLNGGRGRGKGAYVDTKLRLSYTNLSQTIRKEYLIMAKLKNGDPVKVAAREQTAQDIKSGLYYPHYANLTGTILKVYGEEASVRVDRESLPEDVRLRHDEGEKAMR